jgi:hypothetical protein
MHFPYHADSFFLHRRSRAAAQEVPPELLQFRYWLAVWSEKPAKLQDANENKRHAAILEDGLNGAYNQQGVRSEGEGSPACEREAESYEPGAEERSEGEGKSAEETEV